MKRFVCITLALAVFAAVPVLAQSDEKATTTKTCAADCQKACCQDKAKSCSSACQKTCEDKGKAASCCGTCGGKAKAAAASCSQTCSKTDAATCSKTGCSKTAAACSKTGCSKTGNDQNCVGESVAVKGVMIPRMAYKIGDECVKCPKAAAELAKKNNAEMQYVVGDKVYTDKGEAVEAQAKVIDAFLDELLTVKYAVGDQCVGCPNAAAAMAKKDSTKVQYRVASFNFADRASAEKAIEKARAEAANVKMEWQVGDKKFCCPKSATAVAKTEGKTVEICVGDNTTKCDKTANYELSLARLRAALDSLATAGGTQVAAG